MSAIRSEGNGPGVKPFRAEWASGRHPLSDPMAPIVFTEVQRQVLATVADTFFARLEPDEVEAVVKNRARKSPEEEGPSEEAVRCFCVTSGSDLGVPAAVEEVVRKHCHPNDAQQVSILLSVLGSRAGSFLLFGSTTPFCEMSLTDRVKALVSMKESYIRPKRKAFLTLQKLVSLMALARDKPHLAPRNGYANPMWEAIGYKGPAPFSEVEHDSSGRDEFIFKTINGSITADTEMYTDVIVVGSGCGGAVVAAELARAGHKVLVLEKAAYLSRAEFSGSEGDGLDKLYEGGALVATEDTMISVLAGSAFGGGSTVNWACSLRTPDYVRQEWAAEHGLPRFATNEFEASLDAVCSRLGVTGDGVSHNRNNELFIEGCNAMGYNVHAAPQNMADVSPDAPGAGWIPFGDRYGIKQSMMETYLRDAASAITPAQFADRCNVRRVLHRNGMATGVEADIIGADGVTKHALVVHAATVVVACGSINSPALLLRSGLPNRNGQIGKNLRLHPVMGVYGKMPEPNVSVWRGAPMTTVSNECERGHAGDNYGCKLECPSAHVGIAGSAMSFEGHVSFKELLLDLPKYMITIALTRDKGSGEVKIDKDGQPRLYYPIAEHDRKTLVHGVEKLIRLTAAAGATRIGACQFGGLRDLPPVSEPEARAREVEKLVAEMRSKSWERYTITGSVFSAHQMGTCRMGADPTKSVVNSRGECWECRSLFVADTSVFPTSSGVNPQLTTLATAHMMAQGLKAALSSARPAAPMDVVFPSRL